MFFIKHVLEVSLSGNDALFRYIFFNIYPIVHNIRMSWVIIKYTNFLSCASARVEMVDFYIEQISVVIDTILITKMVYIEH